MRPSPERPAPPTGTRVAARDERRARALDMLVLGGLFLAACALVRTAGFDHVSDDDFARVTIAQAFATTPKLDPSGTSWLPFPFWLLGAALALAGRTLDAARTASLLLAAAAAPLPYLAMRASGAGRRASLAAAGLGLATPWALWLGASTVPELYTAALAAAAAIVLGGPARDPRIVVGGALALLIACLSRYEPWPLAPLLGLVAGARALRATEEAEARSLALAAVLCLAGPLAWMLWNARAHGSAFHFLHRVATYRRAIGQGSGADVLSAILLYPRLFVTTRPELLVGLAVAAPALAAPAMRARWKAPLACAVASVAFLAFGAVQDGAPTHHPERALLLSFVLVAAFVGDAVCGLRTTRSRLFVPAAAIVVGLGLSSLRPLLAKPPGSAPAEDRSGQIARGRALRGAPRIAVSPCAYEHFALVAAYGAPERVDVLPRASDASECPAVVVASEPPSR